MMKFSDHVIDILNEQKKKKRRKENRKSIDERK
jgi:hypothetical protein